MLLLFFIGNIKILIINFIENLLQQSESNIEFIKSLKDIANLLIENCSTALNIKTIEKLKSQDNLEVFIFYFLLI